MSSHEIYSEAILFMLDSMSPTERIQLKDDMRLKLERSYELQPSTLQGLKAFGGANQGERFDQDYPIAQL